MSARLNHINNVIKPALKDNKIVISDRFADSTFVYQGFVNNYGLNKTMDLHKKLLDNFLPLKTFLFILPVSEINKRLKKEKLLINMIKLINYSIPELFQDIKNYRKIIKDLLK